MALSPGRRSPEQKYEAENGLGEPRADVRQMKFSGIYRLFHYIAHTIL